MALIRRQKITIVILVLYWIILAIVAHIPIPKLVYQAQVSDKWLHFLAYMNLTFLLWFSLRPVSLVRWRRKMVWLILFIVVVYGGIDELLQPLVGRTKDFGDFLANVSGILTGLALFTFLSFWPAFLAVMAITIFSVTNLARADLSKLAPTINILFHIFAYAGFALIWAKFLDLYLPGATRIRRMLLTVGTPVGLLLIVKAGSLLLGRPFAVTDLIFAFLAIIAVTIARRYFSLPKGL